MFIQGPGNYIGGRGGQNYIGGGGGGQNYMGEGGGGGGHNCL